MKDGALETVRELYRRAKLFFFFLIPLLSVIFKAREQAKTVRAGRWRGRGRNNGGHFICPR